MTREMVNFVLSMIKWVLASAVLLCIVNVPTQAQVWPYYGNGTELNVPLWPGDFQVDAFRAFIDPPITSSVTFVTITHIEGSWTSALNDKIVLIIGMKSCSGTGNWEFNAIKSINGTTVELVNATNSSNVYTHAQIILVPQYLSLSIPNGSSLTCAPWDGFTGGVVAFLVKENLSIDGTISASEKGFDKGLATVGGGGAGGLHGDGGPAPGASAGDGKGGKGIGLAGNGGGPYSVGEPDNISVAGAPSAPCTLYALGVSATNESNLLGTNRLILMGGGGWSGTGGQGGGGGGGSGGDAPCCGGVKGNDGSDGAPGVTGGNGGRGGGIVIFKAQNMTFGNNGKIDAGGVDGANGGYGGQGGAGGAPNANKGAGAGSGGPGGIGGRGASGGAGGIVYYTKFILNGTATVNTKGGLGKSTGPNYGGGHSANAALSCNGSCPCDERFCACDDVWEYMLGAECYVPDAGSPDIKYYDKKAGTTLLSRCIAQTSLGGLTITCSDYNNNPACIYHCDMAQDPPLNNLNPDACLSILCGDHESYDPYNYTICDLNCNPVHFKAATGCCDGSGDGRGKATDGTQGTAGAGGKDAEDGDFLPNDEPPPTPLNPTGSVINLRCKLSETGGVYISVTGGIPPYTYHWSDGATTHDITGLSAGTYTVTITDANFSTSIGSWTVTEPDALVVSPSAVITPVLCYGRATGAIDIEVSGGTLPYTYRWSNGATTQDLNGVGTATYAITVTDGNGCLAYAAFSISGPPALSVGVSMTNVACYGGTSTVTLTPSGGTVPYDPTYGIWSLDPCGPNICPYGCDEYFICYPSPHHYSSPASLIAGNYAVEVTDGNGCAATTSFVITEPAAVALSTTVHMDGCAGLADGSIDLTVTGGVLPYSFLWSNGAVSEDITGLAAGTYTVTVADANGCAGTLSQVVAVNPTPLLVITNPAPVCSPSRVDLTAAAVTAGSMLCGATLTYWTDVAATLSMSTPSRAGNGTYYIKATTAMGYYDIKPVIAKVNALPIVFSVTGGGSYCAGGPGVLVGLSGTQTGVNYWLFVNFIPASAPVAGTGYPVSFGMQTASGYYMVLAESTVTPCTNWMYNYVYISIDAPQPVSVSVVASANPVEPGTLVTFTTVPVNGGSTPFYQWRVNGLNTGTNNPVYSYIPVNGDAVSCMLTSSAACASGNPATSNTVVMTVTGVPASVFVTGIVGSGQTECYDAIQTIAVAGGSETFIVENGGRAIMIAGQGIYYHPGTQVEPGGYMSGLIASAGPWCGAKSASKVTAPSEEAGDYPASGRSFFTIYPNPTNGGFSLELRGVEGTAELRVELYGLYGERLMTATGSGERKYDFTLEGKPCGVYFIRVITGKHTGTGKIIKQ